MRAFIAIDLPIEIKDFLSRIQNKLKIELLTPLSSEILARSARTLNSRTGMDNGRESISWVKLQNLHLTLKFLGEISPKQCNEIKQIITEITEKSSGFKIKLESAGVFPNPDLARLIWIGNNQAPIELKQLAEELDKRLVEPGILQDKRALRTHITVGRIKSRLNASDLKIALEGIQNELASVNQEFSCKEITLFESTLGTAGPTYTVLEKFKIT